MNLQPYEAVSVLQAELHSLRGEVIEYYKAMHRVYFALVTTALVFVGLYFDDAIFQDADVKPYIFFGLAQLQYVFVLFGLACFYNQNIHVGHMRVIERRINSIASSQLMLWDGCISKRFLFSPQQSFFWLTTLLGACLLVAYMILMWLTISTLRTGWIYGLIPLEVLSVLILSVLGYRQTDKVEKASMAAMNK